MNFQGDHLKVKTPVMTITDNISLNGYLLWKKVKIKIYSSKYRSLKLTKNHYEIYSKKWFFVNKKQNIILYFLSARREHIRYATFISVAGTLINLLMNIFLNLVGTFYDCLYLVFQKKKNCPFLKIARIETIAFGSEGQDDLNIISYTR